MYQVYSTLLYSTLYLGLWIVEKEADEHQSHFETHQPEHDDTGDD